MNKEQHIHESQYGNYYGNLKLTMINNTHYLSIDDHNSTKYFGPLTETQIEAYNTLCEVKEIRPER